MLHPPPNSSPGGSRVSLGEGNGCEVTRKRKTLLHVSHFLLVSLCLGLETPQGRSGLSSPSLSRRTYRGRQGLPPSFLSILQSLPCFLVSSPKSSLEKSSTWLRRPNALTLLPFYREALEAQRHRQLAQGHTASLWGRQTKLAGF